VSSGLSLDLHLSVLRGILESNVQTAAEAGGIAPVELYSEHSLQAIEGLEEYCKRH